MSKPHLHHFVYNDDGRLPPNFSCQCGEIMAPATFAAWVNSNLDPKVAKPRAARPSKSGSSSATAEQIAKHGENAVIVRHATRLQQTGRGGCELIFSFLSHPDTGKPATVWRENGRLITYYDNDAISQEEA